MFHVEMRMGMQVVREFNLSNERLWSIFLAPLMADREFTIEGHDYIPRHTRLKVYEGAELRPDQLSLGRGWQNVERTGEDVTERVLEQARAYSASPSQPQQQPQSIGRQHPLPAPPPVPVPDALRERLIGRLSAGPVTLDDIAAIAADLMPESTPEQRITASRGAALELLSSGAAHLSR